MCRYVMVLEQDRPLAVLRSGDEGWSDRRIEGVDAVLALPAFGFEVPLSYVYARVIGR